MTTTREWRRIGGKWTRSLGQRGLRVRLFQKRRDGAFYREVWLPGRGRSLKCLHTRHRREAEQLGRQLLAALLEGRASEVSGGPVRLGALWERYRVENSAFLDNKPHSRADTAHRVQVLLGFFGPECDVRTLGPQDHAAYTAARKAGGIRYGAGKVTGPVRPRSVDADLVVLHSLLRWATTVRLADGSRWLDDNPLAGLRRPREANPRRPVATIERYRATRAAMQGLQARSAGDGERARWVKLELALVLAEATGRRLSSIRQLGWDDVDFQRRVIRWRAEHDKKGQEWVIPYPAWLFEEIRTAQRELGVITGWIFAAETGGDRPMDRHLFDKWLMVAEAAAGLAKLQGGLWHPYRRKWATERKGHPLRDVAAAGGWKDTETLLTCYQQPDSETLLRVTSEERKLRDVAV